MNALLLLFSETLDAERARIEERYEDKITNLQKHLKKFYRQELTVRSLRSHHFVDAQERNLFNIWDERMFLLSLAGARSGD